VELLLSKLNETKASREERKKENSVSLRRNSSAREFSFLCLWLTMRVLLVHVDILGQQCFWRFSAGAATKYRTQKSARPEIFQAG
jgi:hypothetical protein